MVMDIVMEKKYKMDTAHLQNKSHKTIAVGMSGGVDSSVAAFLLQQQGYDVIGVFMKNWEDDVTKPEYREKEIGCSWEQDFADMRAVCDMLQIPYITFNFVKEYKEQVFGYFLRELESGRTPNPDILCNQEIKFHLFMKRALELPNVSAVATGHYAAIENNMLLRPKDMNKDQTYFLYRIDPTVLPLIHFPLAQYTKEEVRQIALENNLATAQKKDSTGICFIGDIDYPSFIDQYVKKQPGNIILKNGTVIGNHSGLHFYTIGQRKGINIGGSGPYYVVEKRMDSHELVVTDDSNDPDLFAKECTVEDLHFLQSIEFPFECTVQIRYRQKEQTATLFEEKEKVRIEFHTPQRAVTSGQSAVFYKENAVIGGGIIV